MAANPDFIWPDGATKERPSGGSEQRAQSFPITWVSDAVLRLDTRPIIKGLFDPGAFVLIYGPSGSGKSFFTADLAQHISTGTAWRGRRVQRSLVVYIASEAGSSILKRFIAWRDNRLPDAAERVPLAILTRGPNLLAGTDFEKLCEQLTTLSSEVGLPIGLVIFDTLSRSIPGGDENSAEDMTMAVNAADLIKERFNAATAYVHHTGKDPLKGARGHYALTAAADLILSIADRVATVEKVRDGLGGERFAFALEPIELGLDADGDPVMTCLLSASEDQGKTPGKAIGKNQRLILEPLKAIIASQGVPLPGTSVIPNGVNGVKFDDLLAACSSKFPGMPGWRVRARIGEALASLQTSGIVSAHNEWIWLA